MSREPRHHSSRVRRLRTEKAVEEDSAGWPSDAALSDTEGTDKAAESAPMSVLETAKLRYRSFRVRTMSTLAMIFTFILIIYAGHVPLALLVLMLQLLMVRELFSLARSAQKDLSLPGFRAQQWYFFFVAAFYLYLRFIKQNLLVELTSSKFAAVFTWVLRRHTIISYLLYMAGFVSFVLSLKRGMYLYQFGQYAWTHMILLVVFVPSSFFVSNIFEGLIWFLLPCCLIIVNDIMAYLAGFFFGRTPLIKLSPKKTWEGFIGGFLGTVVSAFFLAKWFSQYKWMTCPRQDLSIGKLDCQPDEIFQVQEFTLDNIQASLPQQLAELVQSLRLLLPAAVLEALQNWRIEVEPMQVHAMVLACFASFVAPFGGFFASGFKRAFRMKDFGDTIPGHGGVTDRFDCQMIMAMFAYLYYWNFVAREQQLTVGHVLDDAQQLNDAQQLELFGKLGNMLIGEGLLPMRALDSVHAVLRAANTS